MYQGMTFRKERHGVKMVIITLLILIALASGAMRLAILAGLKIVEETKKQKQQTNNNDFDN